MRESYFISGIEGRPGFEGSQRRTDDFVNGLFDFKNLDGFFLRDFDELVDGALLQHTVVGVEQFVEKHDVLDVDVVESFDDFVHLAVVHGDVLLDGCFDPPVDVQFRLFWQPIGVLVLDEVVKA